MVRGHTDLNHGPIGLQPIALPLSYIPDCKSYLKYLGHDDNYYYISIHVAVRHLVTSCVLYYGSLSC